jgi:HlyD family secretion protein
MQLNRCLTRVTIILLSTIIITACGRNNDLYLPGYVEGRYTYISPYFSGVIKSVDVKEGDEVKTGQLLFALVPEPEYDDLVAAQERVARLMEQQNQMQAEYDLQIKVLERRLKLINEKFVSQEEVDTTQAKYNEAKANLLAQKDDVEGAKADLKKAEWQAKQKVVYAPTSGLVFDTYYTQGELVEYGNPVLSLLDPKQVKIYFFLNENLLGKIRLNQIVDVLCDNCTAPIKSKIVFISPKAEYTPPVIYSNEVRDKLVYRIEAQPLAEKSYLIVHPGQPITVHLINP